MKLTNIEKETIVTYNMAESTAEIYTHDPKLIKKLDELISQYPELYKLAKINKAGGVSVVIPKKYLVIRLNKPISAEISKARSERVKKLNPLGLKFK